MKKKQKKGKAVRGRGADSLLLDTYETLRVAHTSIKDLVHHPRYEEFPVDVKTSIEAVHNTLYMAEYIVIKEDLT